MTLMVASGGAVASLTRFACFHSGIASQNETRGVCLGDALPVLIGQLALDVANVFPAIRHARLGAQQRAPDGTEEVYVQRHGGEGFVRLQRRGESHTHRRVSEVTQNSAVR